MPGGTAMRYRWPENTPFTPVVLTVEQQACSLCRHRLHVCDHRFHRVFSLSGPLELVCKLAHCPDPACPAHHHTLRPLAETHITLPWWLIAGTSSPGSASAASPATGPSPNSRPSCATAIASRCPTTPSPATCKGVISLLRLNPGYFRRCRPTFGPDPA
jgi:hypothetical protein